MSFPPLTSLYGAFFMCEVVFLILAIVKYKKLQFYHLGIILPLLILWVLLDAIFLQLPFHKIFDNRNILEVLTLVLTLKFRMPLKSNGLVLLTPVIALLLTTDLIVSVYQVEGWYNVHLYNAFHLVGVMLSFGLFYKSLHLNRQQINVYIGIATIVILIFLTEFILNKTPRVSVNLITTIGFYTQNIILCGLSVYKIIENPNVRKLHYEPLFWLLTGFLADGIINIVFFAFHPYLVAHIDEIRYYQFFPKLVFISRTFLELCIFIAIVLCARKYSLENAATTTTAVRAKR
jgi:hypothetical protein